MGTVWGAGTEPGLITGRCLTGLGPAGAGGEASAEAGGFGEASAAAGGSAADGGGTGGDSV